MLKHDMGLYYWFLGALLVQSCLISASVQTCNEDLYAIVETLPDGSNLALGTNVSYQGASIQTYISLPSEAESCNQGPESVGIRITAPDGLEDWLTNKLPVDPDMLDMGITPGCEDNPLGPGCVPPNDLISLSFPGANTTFNPYVWQGMNWNPMGHPPLGVYSSPHFDFHFFQMPESEVNAILPAGSNDAVVCTEGLNVESFAKANTPIPEMCFPEGYANLNAVAPFMGNHYIQLAEPVIAAALSGKPDKSLWEDPSWIMGGYDGEITFLEPMVKRKFLQDMVASYLEGNGTEKLYYAGDVTVPREYPDPGYHATSFSIRIESPETMWVSLGDFTLQESSGCAPTDPKAPTSYLDWAPPPPDAPPLPEACTFTKSPSSSPFSPTAAAPSEEDKKEEEETSPVPNEVSMQNGQSSVALGLSYILAILLLPLL